MLAVKRWTHLPIVFLWLFSTRYNDIKVKNSEIIQMKVWKSLIFKLLPAPLVFTIKHLTEAFRSKDVNIWLVAHDWNTESDATFTGILLKSIIFVCWDALWLDGEPAAVIRVKYCVCTVSEMTLCSVTAGVAAIRPRGDLSVRAGRGRRGFGSCTVAPRYQQGPLFNGEAGVRKLCGRWTVIYTLILSYISVLLCSLAVDAVT